MAASIWSSVASSHMVIAQNHPSLCNTLYHGWLRNTKMAASIWRSVGSSHMVIAQYDPSLCNTTCDCTIPRWRPLYEAVLHHPTTTLHNTTGDCAILRWRSPYGAVLHHPIMKLCNIIALSTPQKGIAQYLKWLHNIIALSWWFCPCRVGGAVWNHTAWLFPLMPLPTLSLFYSYFLLGNEYRKKTLEKILGNFSFVSIYYHWNWFEDLHDVQGIEIKRKWSPMIKKQLARNDLTVDQ